MPKLHVGDEAPRFRLPSDRGDEVSLENQLARGPVVLIFYPMDKTPGCTKQLCAVRDDHALYEAAGATVLAINNGSAESHRSFAEKYGFTATMLVDRDFAVASAYDAVIGFGPLRVVNRTVVGIGTDGRIAYYQRGMPLTDAILAGVAR